LTLIVTRRQLDGSFYARRLARSEVIACASPEYLDRRGRPQHPRELVGHAALIPPISELQRGLPFSRGPEDGPETEVYITTPKRGLLNTLHVDTNYAAALAGLGIAGLPSFVIEDALAERALERVLPEWRLYSSTLWLAMPSRQHVPARTLVLHDFLVSVFGGEDRDPWLDAVGCATPGRREPAG